MNNKKISLFFLVIGIILGLSGCSTKATNSIQEETTNTKIEQENNDIITNFSDLDLLTEGTLFIRLLRRFYTLYF